jgi:predicted permease
MLFRGFPVVKRNDRLVYLQERWPSGLCCITYPDFEEWRAQAHSFEGLAFVGERMVSLRDGDGRPIDTMAFTVSANTFGLLGVPPIVGRDFVPADEIPGAAPVAILNYRFWETRFGKRADIAGLTIHINGAPATIVGVMPERFDFPTRENLWMPLPHGPELQQRGVSHGFTAVGRLKDGVRLQEARAELETINRGLETKYPATNRGLVPTVATHSQISSGLDAPIIWGSLWAAAWFVLLIACANLANLTLARTVSRWREFAIRIALGAGQGRMIRQIILESLVLVIVSAALGWWMTTWGVRAWAAATASQYQILDYAIDRGTFAYLIGISLAALVLVSLAPIGRVLQLSVSVTQGLRGKRLSVGLVAAQMALAVVLLSGAGVLVRSFATIVGADTGVRDPEQVLVVPMRLPSDKYPNLETRVRYFDRLEAQLKALPGIEREAVSSNLPVRGVNRRSFEIEGRRNAQEDGQAVQFVSVGPDYFQVMRAPVAAGRDFDAGDRIARLPVAIVNQSFAETFFPGEDPLGKHLRRTDQNRAGQWQTIVGVAANIMQGDALRQRFKPVVYVPVRQAPPARAYFFARTSIPPLQVARAVRAEMQKLDPDVLLDEFATLKDRFAFERDYMDAEHSELGKHATVAPVFAVIALLLAAIGLVAVIAHSVTQRTKEIGVRMAIGAAAADVRRMIVHQGMMPAAIGLVIGLSVSLGVNRVLQSQLVGVSPYDPLTMASAPILLLTIAWAACQIPARQAVQIDPCVALRHE